MLTPCVGSGQEIEIQAPSDFSPDAMAWPLVPPVATRTQQVMSSMVCIGALPHQAAIQPARGTNFAKL